MRINEGNFFDNWKEFTIKRPDETILNHLDVIKNHTNLDGRLKHNNRELIKVFSLFITHNYGSHVYELCNFLKYLNQIKFPLYNVMVLNSSEIIQKIKKIEFSKSNKLNVNMTLKIEKHSFILHYNRISTYIIMLDFIEEFLGLEEIYSLDNKVNNLKFHKELKNISNDISKKIYFYFKNLLPSSYLQNFSTIIGNEIIENNSEDHMIVSEDITDDFILNFWIKYSSNKNDLLVKTFSLAADFCMVYKKAIDINKINPISFGGYSDGKDAWSNLSEEDVNTLLEELVDNSQDNIFISINKIKKMQDLKINILKKKEIDQLLIFSKYQKTSFKLSLTIFRICIFSRIQNKVIESERRKKSNFDNLLDTNLGYKDQFQNYKELILNIDFIKEIIFYKLWAFNKIEYFLCIRDFLDRKESTLFDLFVKEEQILNKLLKTNDNKRLIAEDDDDKLKIENISKKFKQILKQDDNKYNFSAFRTFLEKLKLKSRTFRRNGFEFKSANDKNFKNLDDLYLSLTEINNFLNQFLNFTLETGLNLKVQLDEDKKIFFKQFNILYPRK